MMIAEEFSLFILLWLLTLLTFLSYLGLITLPFSYPLVSKIIGMGKLLLDPNKVFSKQVLLLLLSHFSRVQLWATPWTAPYKAPPSMGFSRQEYRSGVPLPSTKQVLGCSKEINKLGTTPHRHIFPIYTIKYKNCKGCVSVIIICREIKLFVWRKYIEWADLTLN